MRKKFKRGKQLKQFYLIPIALFVLFGFVLVQYDRFQESQPVAVVQQPTSNLSKEPIQPIPVDLELDPKKVKLGERLFHDRQLSRNNTISCASCHNLEMGGSDRLAHSIGIDGKVGFVNAPTVFNSGFNFKQFWDGRANTLKEQIDGPIHSEHEMDSSWPEIIGKLQQSPEYVRAFEELYPNGIQRGTIKDAIATFVESLYTPNSRFDRFLQGETDALTAEEQEGYSLFKGYGCVSCHQGINIGGNMFQVVGVIADYIDDRGDSTPADRGRFNVTGEKDDLRVFKVPSLRNIALTFPYFHDGSVSNIEEAVFKMGKYQLGRDLSPTEVERLVQFLKTLTGQYQGRSL